MSCADFTEFASFANFISLRKLAKNEDFGWARAMFYHR